MTFTIETEVPSLEAAQQARQELPGVTLSVFEHLKQSAPNWDTFRHTLELELQSRSWEDAVSLMESLQKPGAAIALARQRHEVLAARGDLTFGVVGGSKIGKRYMSIREEPLVSNAQLAISSLIQHLARNHKEGDITTDGYERHVKLGAHAPFLEFQKPEQFRGTFVRGSGLVPVGQDQRIVLPNMMHGAVVVLTRKTADHAAILLTTSTCSEDQIQFAKTHDLYRNTHARIIHGSDARLVAALQSQLGSGIAAGRGTVRVSSIPSKTFDLAIDVDNNEFIADFRGSPQWYGSVISQ